MAKPKLETITFILLAGDFKDLQSLMLKNNIEHDSFFNYQILDPKFDGDKWKALYLKDAVLTLETGESLATQ